MLGGRSEAIVVVIAVMLALSLVTVCLRCFVRLRVVKTFGWDDSLMALAMIFNLAFAICGLMGATFGIGRRLVYFQDHPSDFRRALFCWWLGQIFYVLTTTTMRQSIVIFLFRFTFERVYNITLYAVSILSFAMGMVFLFFTIFQCSPVAFYWNRLTMRGHCTDVDILTDIVYCYSAVAAACDLTIGLLPAFLLRNLRATRRTKIGIAVILGIGCVASAAVIVRIPFLESLKSKEVLHATSQVSIWSNVEASLGITAGSLAPLRPLLRILSDAIASFNYQQVLIRIKRVSNSPEQNNAEVCSVPATAPEQSYDPDSENSMTGDDTSPGLAPGV
ncbi:hypothetical protein BDV12DRAFT_174000 [Aspergillus spectabilis]